MQFDFLKNKMHTAPCNAINITASSPTGHSLVTLSPFVRWKKGHPFERPGRGTRAARVRDHSPRADATNTHTQSLTGTA